MVNEEIRNDDWLLRRLSPDSHFKTDKRTVTRGVFRVNSELDQKISVHVQRLLDDPNNPESILDSKKRHWGIGRLLVEDVRGLGLEVTHDPQPNDYSHSIVTKIAGEIDQEMAERLREKLEVIRYPLKV